MKKVITALSLWILSVGCLLLCCAIANGFNPISKWGEVSLVLTGIGAFTFLGMIVITFIPEKLKD